MYIRWFCMVKTLRVSDVTYKLVMDLVGQLQIEKKEKISVDTALRDTLSKPKFQKDPDAWKKLEKAIFKGKSNIDCCDIDLVQ